MSEPARPRALFFGTPTIAVPALEALCDVAEVVGVVCQPDRPAGRGMELRAPPVKERALALGLAVTQPTRVKTPEFAEWVRAQRADVGLVIAYGRILPQAVLEAPAKGCLNLHASLLPKLRGAAPLTWAIARGEAETGVCLMQMDEGMDTGPVLSAHRLTLDPRETTDSLSVRLGALAAEVVRNDLARALSGELAPVPQDHARATMAPLLNKEHGRIDWSRSAAALDAHVRAMTSWPGAFTSLAGKTLKVLEAAPALEWGAVEGPPPAPGTVLAADKRGLVVACGGGALELRRVQLEGKKPVLGRELAQGRAVAAGMVLGAADGEPATPSGA